MADSRTDGNDSDRRGRAGGSGAADATATAATTPVPERRFSSCSVAAARPIRTVIVIFTVVVFLPDDVFVFISGGGGGGAVVVVVDVRRSHGRPNGSRPWQSIAAAAASRQPSRGRPSRSCSAFGGVHFELACRDTPTGEIFTV